MSATVTRKAPPAKRPKESKTPEVDSPEPAAIGPAQKVNPSEERTEMVSLRLICFDEELVVRPPDQATVAHYAELMADKIEFDAIVLYQDAGAKLWGADGHQRYLAAKSLDREKIKARILHGSKDDALEYALTKANAHGLPLSDADKDRRVELYFHKWLRDHNGENPGDERIAKNCRVSRRRATRVLANLRRRAGCENAPRTGSDGRVRKAPPAPRKAPSSEDAIDSSIPEAEIETETTDKTGHVIEDPKLAAAWREAAERIPQIRSLELQVHKLKNDILDFAKSDPIAAVIIDAQEIRAAFQRATFSLGDCMPHAACPACRGAQASCKSCQGRGWITKARWRCTEKALRKYHAPDAPDVH